MLTSIPTLMRNCMVPVLFATAQAGDLKISEVVDQPKWVVSFHMPLASSG